MKHIYIIGGTMGVGKTTASVELKTLLPNSVMLDGDWCWDANPFQITDETKKMVIDNICYMLNNFIKCNAYKNIIFCWVLHKQSIIDDILTRLNTENCKIKCVSLICSETTLTRRLKTDIENGVRNNAMIQKSVSRLPYYEKLNTIKIDTSDLTVKETAQKILNL